MMEKRQSFDLRKVIGLAIFLEVKCLPVAAKPWVPA
jgi:hypothetical protein